MAKETDRFIVIHREGNQLRDAGIRLLMVDKKTGVTYLLWRSGYGSAITPLLDAEGKPVITELYL